MYMINLNSNQQSIWVGLRSTAFRVGWLLVDGGMLWLVGYVAGASATPLSPSMLWAWQVTFYVLAAITFVTAAYNFWAFPQDPHRDAQDGVDVKTVGGIVREFGRSVVTFMEKPNIVWGILFLVLYRTGEAQLLQILPSFFTDPVSNGGLEIPMEAQGLIKGTIGVITLIIGGIIGGFAIARKGLRFWLLPMILILNLPNIGYILLGHEPRNSRRDGYSRLGSGRRSGRPGLFRIRIFVHFLHYVHGVCIARQVRDFALCDMFRSYGTVADMAESHKRIYRNGHSVTSGSSGWW